MPISRKFLYNWKIGGEAGYGIMNTGGPIFAKTLLRAGFFVFIYSEYPSLIRGGHNAMQVAVSSESLSGVYSQIDQLVALNAHTIVTHQNEVKKGGIVLYDSDIVKLKTPARLASRLRRGGGQAQCEAGRQNSKLPPALLCSAKRAGKTKSQISKLIDNSKIPALTGIYTVHQAKRAVQLRQDIKFIPVNFTKIAEEAGGDKIMKNVAAVGAGLRITNYKLQITNLLEIANKVLAGVFVKKGQDIIKVNQRVLEAGYNLISNF